MESFWHFLRHCENSKNRTACRREHEIEGWVGQKCQQNHKKNASKMDPKTKAKNRPKIDLKWKPNGAKMEPKRYQKINVFWLGFRTPLETLAGLRGDCGGTAGVAASVTLSPADPPGRRHIIKDYCTIISKDGWLAGSNTPRAVGPAKPGG